MERKRNENGKEEERNGKEEETKKEKRRNGKETKKVPRLRIAEGLVLCGRCVKTQIHCRAFILFSWGFMGCMGCMGLFGFLWDRPIRPINPIHPIKFHHSLPPFRRIHSLRARYISSLMPPFSLKLLFCHSISPRMSTSHWWMRVMAMLAMVSGERSLIFSR